MGLKKEIKERDDTIGDKEKRIYDLKKKNQGVITILFTLFLILFNFRSPSPPHPQVANPNIYRIGEIQIRAGLQDQGTQEADRATEHGDRRDEGSDQRDGWRVGEIPQDMCGAGLGGHGAQDEGGGPQQRDCSRKVI